MFSLKIVKGAELVQGVQPEVELRPDKARFTIGRDAANDWVFPDRTLAVSACHCEIVTVDGVMVLRDLSTNGTFVNGASARLAGPHVVTEGDRFSIGPFTIAVGRGSGLPLRPVEAGTAMRGLDPAATVEIEVTKIRAAPPRTPAAPAPAPSRPAPVATPAAPRPSPQPAAATAAGDPVLAALAAGLGVSGETFAGRDPAALAGQVAAIARTAIDTLRKSLEQQALARRQIGSRQASMLPMRDVNPLRLATSTEAALLALLAGADPGATLQRTGAEVAQHHERLLAAFRTAAQRLGQEIEPAALEAALAAAGDTTPDDTRRQARLWELYGAVWHSMGLAPGQPWSAGFLEALMLQMAAAYDAPGTG